MQIKKILSQYRRDFTAIYECAACGHEHKGIGYDDAFFHEQVIPAMECKQCGAVGGTPTSAPTVPAHAVL